MICYDPCDRSTRTVLGNLIYPNGVCRTSDRLSLLFAETWVRRVNRYWFDWTKRGNVEEVLVKPGNPDNIKRLLDSSYGVALVGTRGPARDLALTKPAFRKRMTRQVALANWPFLNINTGCVIKFTERGEILGTYRDLRGHNHPMVTSVTEHTEYLYLGGVANNRVGK